MNELAQAIATITLEKSKVERELEAMRSAVTRSAEEETKLKDQVLSLQNQVSTLRNELHSVQETKLNLDQQLKDSHSKSVEDAKSNLENKLKESQRQNELQKKDFETELSGLRQQLLSAQHKIEVSLEREQTTLKSNSNLSDQLQQYITDNGILIAKLSTLSEALEAEKAKRNLLENRLQSMETTNHDNFNEHGKQNVNLMTKVVTIDEQSYNWSLTGPQMETVQAAEEDYNREDVVNGLPQSDLKSVLYPSSSKGLLERPSLEQDTTEKIENQSLQNGGDQTVMCKEQEGVQVLENIALPVISEAIMPSMTSEPIISSQTLEVMVSNGTSKVNTAANETLEAVISNTVSEPAAAARLSPPAVIPGAEAENLCQIEVPVSNDTPVSTGEDAVLSNSEEQVDFEDLEPVKTLSSSQLLHKKEVGRKLVRKRPSRSHLQKMGEESGINVSTGSLVPMVESPDEGSDHAHMEALHKVPAPAPRPKPASRTKDKGTKLGDEHDSAPAECKPTSADMSSTSRPSTSRPPSASESALSSAKNSPKPSPRHIGQDTCTSSVNVVTNVDDMNQKEFSQDKKESDDKGSIPQPLPKPRTGSKPLGDAEVPKQADQKLDEILAKDPSQLTIKEKALLAERTFGSKDRPKLSKKPDTAATILVDQNELPVQQQDALPISNNVESLPKPRKLPPGAFSMVGPSATKLRLETDQQDNGGYAGGDTYPTQSSDNLAAAHSSLEPAESKEKGIQRKLPAGAFSLLMPGPSPADNPVSNQSIDSSVSDTQRRAMSISTPAKAEIAAPAAKEENKVGIVRSGSDGDLLSQNLDVVKGPSTPPKLSPRSAKRCLVPTAPAEATGVLPHPPPQEITSELPTSYYPASVQPQPSQSSTTECEDEPDITNGAKDADTASIDDMDMTSTEDYTQVSTWTAGQVCRWLTDAGLSKWTRAFAEKGISGADLLELDGAKLKAVIPDSDDRTTFKKRLKTLKSVMERQKKRLEKQKKEEKKKQELEKKQQKKKAK